MIDLTENMPSLTQLLPPLGDAAIQGVIVRESDGTVDFRQLRDDGFTAVSFRSVTCTI